MVPLCPIHVLRLRYFKDTVFTGKAYWGDAGDKIYLAGDKKEELVTYYLHNKPEYQGLCVYFRT